MTFKVGDLVRCTYDDGDDDSYDDDNANFFKNVGERGDAKHINIKPKSKKKKSLPQ